MDSTPSRTAATPLHPTTDTVGNAALAPASDGGVSAGQWGGSEDTIPPGAVAPIGIGHSDDDDDHRPRALVVQLGNREFAIPVEQVRGVVRHETLTRVPGAPDMVRGIVNVRGSVVTVLELSVLLRAERAVTAPSIVLLEHGTRLVGITVDAVRDVRIFEPSVVSATLDGNATDITPLDAVALCAPHLLSSEEMGP